MSSRPNRGTARLAAILDALPDAVLLVNSNGTVVDANAAAVRGLQAPGTSLVGRGVLDLLPEFDPSRIPGSMRPRPAQGGEEEDEEQRPKRTTARRTDGSTLPVEVVACEFEDDGLVAAAGLTGGSSFDSLGGVSRYGYGSGGGRPSDRELLLITVRDLTARLEVESELRRQHKQTEMILRAAAEGVIGVDTDGRVVLVNPAAAHLLGHRAGELGGRELLPLVMHSRADGTPLLPEESPLLDTLDSGRRHRVREAVLWRKDGRPVPVELSTAPVRDGDQLVGAVMTFADRTAHEALTDRHHQLEALLEGELRAPLERLDETLEQLARDPAGQLWPEANWVLRRLAEECRRTSRLVEGVLAHQRLEADLDQGRAELDRRSVPLDRVLDLAVTEATALVGADRVQFAVHPSPVEVVVDVERLAQALAHLIAAVALVPEHQQTGPGVYGMAVGVASGFSGGMLPGQGGSVVIAAAQRGDVARIEVRGPGEGGDVHLPIARAMVERHGGVLQAHELPGRQERTYVVELPLDSKATRPGPAPRAARPTDTAILPELPALPPARPGTASNGPADAGPIARADAAEQAARGEGGRAARRARGAHGGPGPDGSDGRGSQGHGFDGHGGRTREGQGPDAASADSHAGAGAGAEASGGRVAIALPAGPSGPQDASGPGTPAQGVPGPAGSAGSTGSAGELVGAVPVQGGRHAPARAAEAIALPAARRAEEAPAGPADPTGTAGSAAATAATAAAPEPEDRSRRRNRLPAPEVIRPPRPAEAVPAPASDADRHALPALADPDERIGAVRAAAAQAGAAHAGAAAHAVSSHAGAEADHASTPGAGADAGLDSPATEGRGRRRRAVAAPPPEEPEQPGPTGAAYPGLENALPPAGSVVAPEPRPTTGAGTPGGRRRRLALGPDLPAGEAEAEAAPTERQQPAEPVAPEPLGRRGRRGRPEPAAEAEPVQPRTPIALGPAAPAAPEASAQPAAVPAPAPLPSTQLPPTQLPPAQPPFTAAPPAGAEQAAAPGPSALPPRPGFPGPAVPAAEARPTAPITPGVPVPPSLEAYGNRFPGPAGPQAGLTGPGSSGRTGVMSLAQSPLQATTTPPRGTPLPPLPNPDEPLRGPGDPFTPATGAGAPDAAPDRQLGWQQPEFLGGYPQDGQPRRLLVWPAPDASTAQALVGRGYQPVNVQSREEVEAQTQALPAALFVDPLTGPITRTALQSLRTAAGDAQIPVLVTAGLGQAAPEAVYGADPAVLLRALAPRDSERHAPRVLLVEPDPYVAGAFTASLERRGMHVQHAASESEAVAAAPGVQPNLVVMDLMLIRPHQPGIVDWLRDSDRLRRTPLLVYTSAPGDPEQRRGLRTGETMLFLAERATTPDVQQGIVDLLSRIG